jgi:hypothetical protein
VYEILDITGLASFTELRSGVGRNPLSSFAETPAGLFRIIEIAKFLSAVVWCPRSTTAAGSGDYSLPLTQINVRRIGPRFH